MGLIGAAGVMENREKWKREMVKLFCKVGSRDHVKDNTEDGEQQSKEAQRLGNGAHYVEAEQAQRCKRDHSKNDLLNKISDFVTHFNFSFIIVFIVNCLSASDSILQRLRINSKRIIFMFCMTFCNVNCLTILDIHILQTVFAYYLIMNICKKPRAGR